MWLKHGHFPHKVSVTFVPCLNESNSAELGSEKVTKIPDASSNHILTTWVCKKQLGFSQEQTSVLGLQHSYFQTEQRYHLSMYISCIPWEYLVCIALCIKYVFKHIPVSQYFMENTAQIKCMKRSLNLGISFIYILFYNQIYQFKAKSSTLPTLHHCISSKTAGTTACSIFLVLFSQNQ